MIKLIIPGGPLAKQSARFYSRGGRMFSYQPKAIVDNKAKIALYAKKQLPKGFKTIISPIRVVRLYFMFKPLSSHSKAVLGQIREWDECPMADMFVYKTTKPDIDNLIKGTADALEGIVFKNDSQICQYLDVRKGYSYEPRTELWLEEIKG